jgi:hypothetical protein
MVAVPPAMQQAARASALAAVVLVVGCGLAVTGQATEGAAAGGDGSLMNASSSGEMTASSSGGDAFDGGLILDHDATVPFDAHQPGLPDARPDALPARDASPASDAGSFCSKLMTCCTWIAAYTDSGVGTCESTAASNDPASCAYLLGVFQSAYLCLGL